MKYLKYSKAKEMLLNFKKSELIEYIELLYKTYISKEKIDYGNLSDSVLPLSAYTICISYDILHPTKIDREKESSTDWMAKTNKLPERRIV
jgi:hypothetical protein